MPFDDYQEFRKQLDDLKGQVDAMAKHVKFRPHWKEATKLLLTSFEEAGGDSQVLWNQLWLEMSPKATKLPCEKPSLVPNEPKETS